MSRLYNVLALTCIVVVLAAAGLVIYLAAAGRLNARDRCMLGRWLRGGSLIEAPSAAQRDLDETARRPAAATRQLAADASRDELLDRLVDRRLAEIGYQQEQLEVLRKLVDMERDTLLVRRADWRKEVEAARSDTRGAAFQRQLKLFESLRPKQVRELLMDMEDEQAGRCLAAMKRQTAADVMGQFKTEPQKQWLGRLLQQLRQDG